MVPEVGRWPTCRPPDSRARSFPPGAEIERSFRVSLTVVYGNGGGAPARGIGGNHLSLMVPRIHRGRNGPTEAGKQGFPLDL